jgi:hypothetical protein
VSPVEEYESSLRKLQRALTTLRLRFHLTGGVASIAHGEPRMTLDLDVVIDRQQLSAGMSEFLSEISQGGYVYTEQTLRNAVAAGRQFQLFDADSGVKIDFYPRELVPGELKRSVEFEIIPGLVLPIVSRCDLAIAKLIWISKGSHKSRRDLRQILARATEDERQAIRIAADDSGLSTLLGEVLSESDEIAE